MTIIVHKSTLKLDMDNTQEEYLTPEQVAEKLKVKKITIYRMARSGKIPAIKFGKSWRISSIKLAEFLEKESNKNE